MASLAVSEDGIPFRVGEDLFKSRRRKIVQPQEVRSQLRRRGFFVVCFCLPGLFFSPYKNTWMQVVHHQMTPQVRMWESASCDASSNTSLLLSEPAGEPVPVPAESPYGQTRRSVCGDSTDSRNVPTGSRGQEPHRGRARDDGRWYSFNRLPKGRNSGGYPASLILVRPDRPPPSTPSILPPLIPLHLSIFLSGSPSSPPQLAEGAWPPAHLPRNAPP